MPDSDVAAVREPWDVVAQGVIERECPAFVKDDDRGRRERLGDGADSIAGRRPVRDSRRAVREAKASDDRVVALPDDQDRAAEVVHLNVRRHVGGEGVGPARRRLAGLRRAGYRQ